MLAKTMAVFPSQQETLQLLCLVIPTREGQMSRNTLYTIIGILTLAVIVLGYGWYNEASKTSGVDINLGDGGMSITTK
jgi:hypothetical protein